MDINYNIEDTGKLMTSSRRGNRSRRAILLAIAGVLIIAIALVGFKLIQDKRYNDRIELAEKAFATGDYETAETEYLAAMQINKNKPKAREGLAYTYAVEGKTDEAVEMYDNLYKDTDDPKYEQAREDVINGRLPSDPDLVPAQGLWRSAEVADIPYFDNVFDFLFNFYIDAGWEFEEGRAFDCNSEDSISVLTLPMTGMGCYETYGIAIEDGREYDWDEYYGPWGEFYEGVDPLGWNAEDEDLWVEFYGGYERYKEEDIEWIMKTIFNLSDGSIERMLQEGESDRQVYKQNGYYYCVWGWPTGTPGEGDAIEINKVYTDGVKYCICYDAGMSAYYDPYGYDYDYYDDHYEESMHYVNRYEDYVTMYALYEIKVIDGKHYISLYYNGPEMPAEVSEGLAATYSGGQDSGVIFSEISDLTFVLAIGAGGWETDLYVNDDGSFTGNFHDSDMGVTGSSYPNGTVYYSNFSGKFTNPRKISDYEYRFDVQDVKTEDKVDSVHIDDGVRYIAKEPYGVTEGNEVTLYLPGTKIEDLPEGYLNWLWGRGMDESEYDPVLTFYGLYNAQEDLGFVGYSN